MVHSLDHFVPGETTPLPSYTQYFIVFIHIQCCLFLPLVSLAEGTELYLCFHPQMQDVEVSPRWKDQEAFSTVWNLPQKPAPVGPCKVEIHVVEKETNTLIFPLFQIVTSVEALMELPYHSIFILPSNDEAKRRRNIGGPWLLRHSEIGGACFWPERTSVEIPWGQPASQLCGSVGLLPYCYRPSQHLILAEVGMFCSYRGVSGFHLS